MFSPIHYYLFIRLLYYILKTRSQDWAKIPKKVKSQKTTLFATKRLISILFYKCFQGPEEWRYSWTDSFVTATCFVDWKLERTPDYITFHISRGGGTSFFPVKQEKFPLSYIQDAKDFSVVKPLNSGEAVASPVPPPLHISYIKIYNIQQKITKIWGFEKLSHKIEVNRMQLDLYYFSLILHHPHAPFFRILAPCWFR